MTSWTAPDVDRSPSPRLGSERESLQGWLDFHRQTLLAKCAGLDHEQLATRSVPPSRLSLLGLVRHMAEVEALVVPHLPARRARPRLLRSRGQPRGRLRGPRRRARRGRLRARTPTSAGSPTLPPPGCRSRRRSSARSVAGLRARPALALPPHDRGVRPAQRPRRPPARVPRRRHRRLRATAPARRSPMREDRGHDRHDLGRPRDPALHVRARARRHRRRRQHAAARGAPRQPRRRPARHRRCSPTSTSSACGCASGTDIGGVVVTGREPGVFAPHFRLGEIADGAEALGRPVPYPLARAAYVGVSGLSPHPGPPLGAARVARRRHRRAGPHPRRARPARHAAAGGRRRHRRRRARRRLRARARLRPARDGAGRGPDRPRRGQRGHPARRGRHAAPRARRRAGAGPLDDAARHHARRGVGVRPRARRRGGHLGRPARHGARRRRRGRAAQPRTPSPRSSARCAAVAPGARASPTRPPGS